MKKILFFLVTLLATTTLYGYDFKSGDLYYNITGNNTVEVTSEKGSFPVNNYSDLTSVTIPTTVTDDYSGFNYAVTSIGEWAFYGCTNLTTIIIPHSITSIGKRAFVSCTGLTSITIPNNVTDIGDGTFAGVPNIVYKGTATGAPWGARSINGYVDGCLVYRDATKTALLGCSSTAKGTIKIPKTVKSIGKYAFVCCTGITSITIPNSVASIGESAFHSCTSITSITIPNNVTSIGESAFTNVPNIVIMELPLARHGVQRV